MAGAGGRVGGAGGRGRAVWILLAVIGLAVASCVGCSSAAGSSSRPAQGTRSSTAPARDLAESDYLALGRPSPRRRP